MLLLFAGRRRRPTFAVIQRRLGAFPVIVFFFCEKNRSIGRYGCIGHRGKKPNKYGADTKRDSCSSMLPPLPDEQKWDMGLRQGLSIAMFVCAYAHRPWGRIKVNQFSAKVTQTKILRTLCVSVLGAFKHVLYFKRVFVFWRTEVLYFILLACFGPLWAANSRVSLSCLPLEQTCDGSVQGD